MNHRLSTTRSARSRRRTLLSIDKNYARRVDTLYRKAFEAPGAIADEVTRKRCRLAVMQELDGVCTVFLTHNDSSWPPTREQLKDFQILLPHDYISVNQAKGTFTGREPEGDTSGDDDAACLDQPKRLGQDAEPRLLTLVPEGARETTLGLGEQTFAQQGERQSGNVAEEVSSPLEEQNSPTYGLHDTGSIDPFFVNGSPSKDAKAMEPHTPRRRLSKDRRTNASGDLNPPSVVTPFKEQRLSRRDCNGGTSIDPAVLCTPRNKISPVVLTASANSDRTHRNRLSMRGDCSVSPSPRRCRTGVWKTYKAGGGNS